MPQTTLIMKTLSRKLRAEPTPAEALLWRYLRNRKLNGYKFYRQHPIYRYIADFYCPRSRLVIELDGGIHEQPWKRGNDEVREQDIEKSYLLGDK